MATATPVQALCSTEVGEHRFLIRNLGWERYELLLTLFEDGGPRINYCGGDVELMSPLSPHERPKKTIGFMVETIAEELDIPMDALASTTFKRRAAARGLEADETYYLWGNAGKVGDQRNIDLDVTPAPDLAIEIEITNSLLNKLSIYAGIGVPEIWKFDGHSIEILWLQPDGTYTTSTTSRAFPFLPMGEITRFLREFDPLNQIRWRRGFRIWVRETLLPLYIGRIG